MSEKAFVAIYQCMSCGENRVCTAIHLGLTEPTCENVAAETAKRRPYRTHQCIGDMVGIAYLCRVVESKGDGSKQTD